MRWEVFKDTMRFSIRMTLIWGIGLGSMMILMINMTPQLQGLELAKLFESMPPTMLAAFGVGDNVAILSTPEGLIAFGLFSKMALIFAAYPVVIGLRASANEENDGILDMVLTQPVPRMQFLFERVLAYVVNIALLMVLVVAGLFIGVWTVPLDQPLDVSKLTVMTLNLIPVMSVVLAATVFTAAIISRRQTVIVIMTIFIIASYMVQTIGAMVTAKWMDPIEALSFFTYYNTQTMLEHGVVPWHVALLIGVSTVLVGVAMYIFDRRDIAA